MMTREQLVAVTDEEILAQLPAQARQPIHAAKYGQGNAPRRLQVVALDCAREEEGCRGEAPRPRAGLKTSA